MIVTNPSNVFYYIKTAKLYNFINDKQKAILFYKKAIKIDPKNTRYIE